MSDDPTWKQVNARRVFHGLSRWIERFLTDLVHEPNDMRLWVRIMRELTAHLEGLHAARRPARSHAGGSLLRQVRQRDRPSRGRRRGAGRHHRRPGPDRAAEFVVTRIIHGTSGVAVATQGA